MADETEQAKTDGDGAEDVAAELAPGAEGEATDDALADEWAALADDDEDGGTARVLSQDEIDSLLGFREGGGGENQRSGIEAIIDSGMVSYERLPMLEVVFDRLVRMLSTSLRNFTSDNVEVSLDNITSIRFGDYLNSIPLPAMLAVFKAEEWDNFGLMTVDSTLIYSIVDVLLGGRRGTAAMRIEGRPYTTIERNLVERMLSVVLADFSAAFDPLSSVTFRFDRLETNPRFATIARPANAAIVARCAWTWKIAAGVSNCCCPMRRSSRSVSCCCKCSWARSSAAIQFGKTISHPSCGSPTSNWKRSSAR